MDKEQEYPIKDEIKNHPAWVRLEGQLKWYDKKSLWNKRWYKGMRLIQIVLASSIPIISLIALEWSKWVSASFGALIAILESAQHLNQFSALWIEYRSTSEYLKHEKFLFLSESGSYRDLPIEESLKLLAERIEENIFKEHTKWVRISKKITKEKGEQKV